MLHWPEKIMQHGRSSSKGGKTILSHAMVINYSEDSLVM